MKVQRYILASSVILGCALLLCLVINSPTLHLVTLIAAVVYALFILAMIPHLVREHRRTMREIRRKLEM